VPELGGTITVVAAGARGVLPQAASIALRISKLDTSFIFISSFNRQCQFRRVIVSSSQLCAMWAYRSWLMSFSRIWMSSAVLRRKHANWNSRRATLVLGFFEAPD
jgi:hypothetical protein